MSKRIKPEDMTPEQRERSDRQKRARADKAARRHEHDGEKHEHDFGNREHTHGIDGIPAFADSGTVPVVTPAAGPVQHPHEGLGSHEHLEGGREHYHNETGAPVFVDKDEATREAEHAAALEAARRASEEAAVALPEVAKDPDADIVLHVIHTGFTVLGKVWYQGEEIRLRKGTQEWDLTLDREGKSWTAMTPSEQIDRYGSQQFGVGPWRGEMTNIMTEDDYLKALASSDVEALRRYEKQRQRQAGPPGRELVTSGPR